jgi:hypothetical protein
MHAATSMSGMSAANAIQIDTEEGHDDAPVFKCNLRADERSRLFKPGYRCPESMTYLELSKSRLLDYVIFYCVHSRDHGDQSREAKGQPEAQSKRSNRSEEATRCLNTGCSFEIRMMRTKDIELPEQRTADELKEMKKNTKFDWYVDSKEDQHRDGRRVITGCNCFTHTGHPRRVYPLSDVTEIIRNRIKEEATNNVSVASIQTIILAVFNVMLSDYQVSCVF